MHTHTMLYTATPSVDYAPTIMDFTFGPDNNRRCVTVPIVNDNILEEIETFLANLTTSDLAVTLEPDTAQVNILRDENDGEKC